MKRINNVFTTINAVVFLGMLVHLRIAYSYAIAHHMSAPPQAAFIIGIFYIPVYILINVIWAVVRAAKCKKGMYSDISEKSDPNAAARSAAWSKLLNIAGIALNVLLTAAMLIQSSSNGDIWLRYILPFILVNEAWVVVHMNVKAPRAAAKRRT